MKLVKFKLVLVSLLVSFLLQYIAVMIITKFQCLGPGTYACAFPGKFLFDDIFAVLIFNIAYNLTPTVFTFFPTYFLLLIGDFVYRRFGQQ